MNRTVGTVLVHCYTVTDEIPPSMFGGQRASQIRHHFGHVGQHEIGIGLRAGGAAVDGRHILREALSLAEGYDDDRDADTVLLTPLLERPEVRPYFINVSDAERAALKRILDEAQDYWIAAGYAQLDRDDDDRVLGVLAYAGEISPYASCWTDPKIEMTYP